MNKIDLVPLIDKFISREDISIDLANQIEVAIDDEFPDVNFMQEVLEMLASYRPGGGDYLYDEDAVIYKLEKLKFRLSQ